MSKGQREAVNKLRSGSILCGGVGSGKSRTALSFYYFHICKGSIEVNGSGKFSPMENPKNLFIITTARKRDNMEWESECGHFLLFKDKETNPNPVSVTVDSWNNIKKYIDVKDAFFIFDEQRVIGSGAWVKAFYKIAKSNEWILATATPGDNWADYIPVFVANNFYKNRTQFLNMHAVYRPFSKYSDIEKFIFTGRLEKFRKLLLVEIDYKKHTVSKMIPIDIPFDKEAILEAKVNRWNKYKNTPIKNASELCFVMRKIVNEDHRRIEAIMPIFKERKKVIIFYNYDYELELLRKFALQNGIPCSEYNGHKHENILKTDEWIYLVQYSSGSEAWNCIETDTVIFYSLNYSYRTMIQAAGRIDRRNTPFTYLFYYIFKSSSIIDKSISKSISKKKKFNEQSFMDNLLLA